jgi:hypothetical protein
VTLTAGGAAMAITVTTGAPGVESGSVRYSLSGLPPGVAAGGAQTTVAPDFAAVEFVLTAAREAAAGTFQPRVRGVFQPGGIEREVSFSLTIERVRPQITGVVPSRVAAGALGQRLAISGRDFERGARIESATPGVRLGATTFVSSERLEATVDIRGDVAGGILRLDVVNPGGERSPSPGIVPVVAASALGGPAAVNSVAVVYPAPGATIADGESVAPRGVLAVSGSGPLVVSWRLDGVPFDRFVVLARGGEPVAVAGRAPIPSSSLGQHLLELVVEGARDVVSRPVALLQVAARESRFRFLSPAEGRVVQSNQPPLLTWTQVPGANGYQVAVVDGRGDSVAQWSVGRARFLAPDGGLARLAAGAYAWQVRPVFAGGVMGEPLEPRRFVLLPLAVELTAAVERRDGALVVRWQGGALGALYRVECVDTAGSVVFAALTTEDHYPLPPAVAEPAGAWRVTALAPDGSVLGMSAPAAAPQAARAAPSAFRLVAAAPVALTAQSPGDGAEVLEAWPAIEARWDNAVDESAVALSVDATDVTALATGDPQSIAYQPLLPLAAGEHQVILALGEQSFEWSFVVLADDDQTGEAQAANDGSWPTGESEAPSWQVDFDVIGTWTDGDELADTESELSATLTLTGEGRSTARYLQVSADVSARQAIAPGNEFEEQNRSWVLAAGAVQAAAAQDLDVGYMAPEFLYGGELLTAGLPEGGAALSLGAGPLSVSYYEAIDPDLEGVVTGVSGAAQELRAAAFELGGDGGSVLRVVGLEVEDQSDLFFAGGKGSLYGLFGSWVSAAGSTATLEVAHGEFTPAPESLESAAEGEAARLVLATVKGQWSFDLGLRWVDPEFINPTNRGLAAGGIPDRQGVDLHLARSWQSGSLDLGLRRYESGNGSAPEAVDSRRSAGDLSLFQRLGDAIDLRLTTGYNRTESDANAALALSAAEQSDWNVALSLSERVGSWAWSQDLALNESDDRFDPTLYSDSSQAGLSVQRSGERFQLFSQVSALRSRFGADRQTTESRLATLQPTWTWAAPGLSVSPFASYSRVEDDFNPAPAVAESYRFTLSWSPPRLAWLSALQVSSEWSRMGGPFSASDDFVARYSASLAIGWGSGRRSAAQAVGAGVYPEEPIPGALLPPDTVLDS